MFMSETVQFSSLLAKKNVCNYPIIKYVQKIVFRIIGYANYFIKVI